MYEVDIENGGACDKVKSYDSGLIINSEQFNTVAKKLRDFFYSKNFVEVHTQNRLSILAACEDPFNVQIFDYNGNRWPLPQTGQMWLEYEILKKPEVAGYFCLTTSYRMEKNPVPGRHDLIFPLFEFEFKGNMTELIELEKELLIHLGYDETKFYINTYKNIATEFNTVELDHDHEERLYTDKSAASFITDFPEFTDPFWNMKRNESENTAYKVDVILSGQETIGSAEREVNKHVMRERFNTIMSGAYKNKLYDLFTEKRTEDELEEYLNFNFFKRCGGGIGMTRLIRSMEKEGLL
jgi:aspartyl/asparaginyl-tRNA synthetase